MRTAILIVTVIVGVVIFFAAYAAASNDDGKEPIGCVYDPRDGSRSCLND